MDSFVPTTDLQNLYIGGEHGILWGRGGVREGGGLAAEGSSRGGQGGGQHYCQVLCIHLVAGACRHHLGEKLQQTSQAKTSHDKL